MTVEKPVGMTMKWPPGYVQAQNIPRAYLERFRAFGFNGAWTGISLQLRFLWQYHRQQRLGLEKSQLWLARKWLAHKGTSTALCPTTQEPESAKIPEELRYFMTHPYGGGTTEQTIGMSIAILSMQESLWFGSSYYQCLDHASRVLRQGIRMQYRQGEGPSLRSSYLETKRTEDGRGTFRAMQHHKDLSVLLAALKASSSSRDLGRGKKLHADAIESGDDSNIYVANTLVDMYAKCGSMVDARGVFDRMLRHDVVSWNALMLGYAENGEGELALQLFACMRPEGCSPNARTFVAALKACIGLAAKEDGNQVDGKLVKFGLLDKGMAIHSQAASSGCDSEIYVANTLVVMYAKCGSMVDAHGVFDGVLQLDVVSWTALILGYAEIGEGELALQLFARMRSEGGAPNARTFVAALKACTSLAPKEEDQQVDGKVVKMGSLEKGMVIHSQAARSGCDSEIYVANSLVDMYAKCGSMVDGCGVFDRMLCHDVVSWNAVMLGYAENGEGELALQLFTRMRSEGCAPNHVTFLAALKACSSLAANEDGNQVDGKVVKMGSLEKGMAIHSEAARSDCVSEISVANTLVDMYAKCGSMVDARRVFDRMLCHDVVSWNALILGYAENGEGELAFELFARMQPEGCAPDVRTFVAALKACSSVGALELGKTFHADICRSGLQSNAVLATSLVDFYGKCGSMVDAQRVFDSLATKDFVTWNALIAGYSHRGDTKLVFDLFERMQNERVQANGSTFQSILTACSHTGLVGKGKEYFQAMCSKYGVNPGIEHYHCMVDILGRANQLDEAVGMVKSMPFKPTVVTWMTVLGACRKWNNVVVGRLAFESLLRLDEQQDAAYLLMASIYGSVGMWEEKSKVQAMRRRNAR